MPLLRFISLQNKSHGQQLIYFILIVIVTLGFFLAIAPIIWAITGNDINDFKAIDNYNTINTNQMHMYKVIQMLSTIGLFIAPPFLFSFFKTGKSTEYLNLNTAQITIPNLLLTAACALFALPLMEIVMQINQNIQLPQFLEPIENWMRNKEDEAAQMTAVFLNMPHLSDLLINLLMMALLPAIGEELFFRGVLQKLILEWTKKPHLSIFIAATIFSFIHFQFFGFFPRLGMGLLLGYLYYYSQNIYYPIIAHFLHNALQVIAVYAGYITLDTITQTQPASSFPAFLQIIGTIACTAAFAYCFILYKNNHTTRSKLN